MIIVFFLSALKCHGTFKITVRSKFYNNRLSFNGDFKKAKYHLERQDFEGGIMNDKKT
jgi:hypothetical protein